MNAHWKWAFGLAVSGLLTALLWAGLSRAQEPALGDAGVGSDDVTAADVVGVSISVQGRLTDASGTPVNGNPIIGASLYDVASGGSALCTYSTSIPVNNGYFATGIYNCSLDVFDGRQLFLGITVGSDAEMTPRATVRLVPYAATVRPGAVIGGSGSTDGSLTLRNVSNRDTVRLRGGAGALYLGSTGEDGDIELVNSSDTWTVRLDGDTGNASQARTAKGFVKAAALVNCSNTSSNILRSFTQDGSGMGIANGSGLGRCKINFGFQISDRFFSATAHGPDANTARMVNCALASGSNGVAFNEIECRRSNADGNGVDGEIMVIIY
jgi:hypothetical protein